MEVPVKSSRSLTASICHLVNLPGVKWTHFLIHCDHVATYFGKRPSQILRTQGRSSLVMMRLFFKAIDKVIFLLISNLALKLMRHTIRLSQKIMTARGVLLQVH